MEPVSSRPTGMAGFTIVWIGQIVSLLGTAVSNFALTLWAYEVTGKATPLALVGFFFVTPMVVLGPFVGVLIDRGNRKLMMMLSDLAAALTTAMVLLLYATGSLQIWHLYIAAAVMGIFQGFQWPAYSAAIALMLPKKQYVRANSMLELAGTGSAVIAPLVAGALIGPLGISGLLIIDLVSAAAAIGTLLFVHIPQPPRSEAGREARGNFLQEAIYGFRYIFARPSLLGLQTVFLVGNFFSALAYAVMAPMILARTGSNELIFASVQTAGAVGGVAGGLGMSAWGGPRRRVHGVLVGFALGGLLGLLVLGVGQAFPIWIVGSFFGAFFIPLINGSNQAIWQAKVSPDIQGRVFATRRLIAWLVSPLSRLVAGPLSDQVLEPAMVEGRALERVFNWLVGSGAGAGMALLFVFGGIMLALTGMGGYLFSFVRNAEDILPDHDAAAGEASPSG